MEFLIAFILMALAGFISGWGESCSSTTAEIVIPSILVTVVAIYIAFKATPALLKAMGY